MSLIAVDTIKEKLKHGCAVRGAGMHGAKCAWMLSGYGIHSRYFPFHFLYRMIQTLLHTSWPQLL